MNTTVITHIGAVTLLLGAGLLHANLDNGSAHPVYDHVGVMERAVVNSSVSMLQSEEQRRQHLDLIQEARNQIAAGNYKTALDQLDRAGRELYPMEGSSEIPLAGEKQRQWLDQMVKAYEAIMPVAQQIAAEKSVSADTLQASQAEFDAGVAALNEGDETAAEMLVGGAYRALQAEVVALRSGDDLVIEQLPQGTEQAWLDAQRRYQDWRYFADWMEQAAGALGIDPDPVAAGSQAADRIYLQAQREAEQARWQEAGSRIDSAYLIMEKHWRQAGLDI